MRVLKEKQSYNIISRVSQQTVVHVASQFTRLAPPQHRRAGCPRSGAGNEVISNVFVCTTLHSTGEGMSLGDRITAVQ